MSTSTTSGDRASGSDAAQSQIIGGIWFDRVMAVLSCCFVGGFYLDGWAHVHGLVDRTFFTPWHAMLYSGYAICSLVLTGAFVVNLRRSHGWIKAVPQGYELSLMAVPLFLLAGLGDLGWHTLFGFEVGIETLLSPTHLLLAFCSVLIVSGPLRATYLRTNPARSHKWSMLLPVMLSWLAIYSICTFISSYASPITTTHLVTQAFGDSDRSWGAANILLQTIILMCFVLFMLRQWQLPNGTFTFIFTLNAALMSVLEYQIEFRLLAGIFAAGLITDLCYWLLKPATIATQVGRLRLFAFLVPVIYFLCYFITLTVIAGTNWSIHLWLGATVTAGASGLLLSYLIQPPIEAESRKSR